MANQNDPPEHQAPDLASGFETDPAVSNETMDGPPPDFSEMLVRLPHPGLWFVDEKGIPVPVTQSGRFSNQNPVRPMQTIHVSLRDPSSHMTAQCGHELSGPMRAWSDHVAIPQPEFERYCNDPTVAKALKDRLCQDCADLPVEEPKSEPKPHPFGIRPKTVATAQVIHARNTRSNPPKKGEPIDGLWGMKMPPGPKKLGDTLPGDRTVSDKVFRRYLIDQPESRPENSTLCGTCIMRFTPHTSDIEDRVDKGIVLTGSGQVEVNIPSPKAEFPIGDLAVSAVHSTTGPSPDQRDYPEMPKTGDKMYFNENEPVPVVVLPGQRFEDIESGQKGHIVAQNLGTYLVDFMAEDGRVFRGLRQSRFVRHSDLKEWILVNPDAYWMFPPPAYHDLVSPQPPSKDDPEFREREAQENDLPLHTEEYNDTLPDLIPAEGHVPQEPPLYSVVKGEADWEFFLHVPHPGGPGNRDRTQWVNTRADWFSWADVYPLAEKNEDFSPVILGTTTPSEFHRLPTLDEWTQAKRKVRDVMNFFRKHGLLND